MFAHEGAAVDGALGSDESWVGDAVVGGKEAGLEEGGGGVGAGEAAGFGGGLEELPLGGTMDGEVVDGFVGLGEAGVGVEGGLRQHRKDGGRIGSGERFVLCDGESQR